MALFAPPPAGVVDFSCESLVVGELGLALLSKSTHALLLVVGREGSMEQSPLKVQSGRQGDLERLVDGVLAHLDNGLGQGSNLLGSLDSLVDDLVGGQDLADQTSALSLLGSQVDGASEAHLHGLGLANGLDQTLRAAGTGDGAELDLGLAKDGLVTSVDDV